MKVDGQKWGTIISSGQARQIIRRKPKGEKKSKPVSYETMKRLAKSGKVWTEKTSTGYVFLKWEIKEYQMEREKKAKTDRRISL